MNHLRYTKRLLLTALILALALTAIATARPSPRPDQAGSPGLQPALSLSPQPSTWDQVIQDKANIVTTVDNFGYIGGYSYYDLPSGEWPRNSGHDYIGEICYWMGCVTPSGDTLVANTYDNFQAVPMPIDGENQYRIYLSTDSTRYHHWDPTDQVGADRGQPAHGWRVWNPASQTWVYNKVWDPLLTTSVDGGPVSLQESYYRFNDAARGTPLLGLQLTQTIMSWNYCYNEDFLFIVLDITNTSSEDYTDFAFGLYIDIDVGGPDGTGENGRLGDMVASDPADNLAWIYDEDGFDPGWGPTVRTGFMGTKYLETPDHIGMTAFRSGDWAMVTNLTDADRFKLINSQQFDESLPPTDQFYIQCTRGINFPAGSTKRVVYALVAGRDEANLRENAALAQQLYDNHFIGPQPPATPTLVARPGNQKVYLCWDDTAEVSVDPMSGIEDFVGYKLYRSDNQGRTWGTVNTDNQNTCLNIDYNTIALYTVNHPGDPIQHSFIDTGLYNGVEYWYCLAAFDGGDTATGVDALQSGFGTAGSATNVAAAAPEADPAGLQQAAGTVVHAYVGNGQPSDGRVVPYVFDRFELTGAEYQVVFADQTEATVWSLLNTTTGDTLLADQTLTGGDPGFYEVVDGLRVFVADGECVPRQYGQTEFATGDTTLSAATFWGATWLAFGLPESWLGSNAPFRCDYELRYTGDSTRTWWILEPWYGVEITTWVPFEVWNTTTQTRVSLAFYDNNANDAWDPDDDIAIVDYPYDPGQPYWDAAFPYSFSWMFVFDPEVYNPAVGDVFKVTGAPLNGPGDRFTFKATGVNAAAASSQLANIKVVPNPYFARYTQRVETQKGQSVLKFINLPDRCTIRVYTLSGDLVTTIYHEDGSGEDEWNLLSSAQQQVASGIYLYHVESPYGERLGRFAVIK